MNNRERGLCSIKRTVGKDFITGVISSYFFSWANQRYINSSNYMEWSRRINEIGKIVGGWYKHYAKAKK